MLFLKHARQRWWPAHLLLWVYFSFNTGAVHALTLREATQRMLQHNPDLQVLQWRLKAQQGARTTAGLTPGYEVSFAAENVLGSGSFSGTDNAELTVSLASVIELGDKRGSRLAVAESRYNLVEAEHQAEALAVIGTVIQQFIAALALQEKLKVAEAATALAETSLRLVSQRVETAAAPRAERFRAAAALTQAQLRQTSLQAELSVLRLVLAAAWGAETADFARLDGDLLRLSQAAAFDELYQRVETSPAVHIFASEARLREAELQLARSQAAANVQWSLGVRRFAVDGATAVTASVSMPLFAGQRNRGAVQTALAERDAVDSRQKSALLTLRARLFEAWQTQQQSAAAVTRMRAEVLPALEEALQQTRQAYERGRYSYTEWAAVQRELLEARLALIDAASTALLNQALIEQLTAQPLDNELAPPSPVAEIRR